MRKLGVAVVAVALAWLAGDARTSTSIRDGYEDSVQQRLEALDKTELLLDEKITARNEQLARRVRGLYKLTRDSRARLWIDPQARLDAVRRRAAARIVAREARELAMIRREMTSARAARARIEADRGDALASIEPRSLFRPVVAGTIAARFGEYRDRTSRVRLVRRGVEFATRAGRNVRAVEAGKVVYVGAIRGVGAGVVVSHTGGYLSVLARVTEIKVARGDEVERGQVLAEANGDRVYLELRVLAGPGGFPIDPAPLLATR